ncbi:hypothetical protein EUTSA_v10001701mg [Eutrema salsugineum]|uniref:Knottins-like domain-containing protein n=1 Tax=Eutrema salsugineum TaxID=72664 RepID=V4LGV5_EUTSA|nr:defensin-like protein 197 [Eutrema salsugineum]ESQ38978.1 hypothetical protein EUTSA_v10001701mg [Eutrema salsugineum]
MKSVSIFLVLFVFFLVVLGSPEKIEAGKKFKCLEEYGGKVGTLCSPKFFPTLCRQNCRFVKGAKNGLCVKKHKHIKCFCDYCKDE